MVLKTRPVTAKAVQALLTRIGSASSGTKDVLRTRFERDVCQPRLFELRPEWKERLSHSDERHQKLRIVSIDMGIKNLASCRAEVGYTDGDPMKPTMDIKRWDKLNLVDASRDLRSHPSHIKEDTTDGDEDVDPYSLSVLSATAYRYIHRMLSEDQPNIILIERQRWRSASSAAIQQWTVRVNTLEAMLWAVLETLRAERAVVLERLKSGEERRDYEICAVDPKRVGQFWLGQHAIAAAERQEDAFLEGNVEIKGVEAMGENITKGKAEKRAKIALLRSWLSPELASTAPSTPASSSTISFTIGAGATMARRVLTLPTPRSSRKKKAGAEDTEDGSDVVDNRTKNKNLMKLDDITDCFLQAAAWVAWESNRMQLYDVWEKKRAKYGQLPPLDEETLSEMVDLAETR